MGKFVQPGRVLPGSAVMMHKERRRLRLLAGSLNVARTHGCRCLVSLVFVQCGEDTEEGIGCVVKREQKGWH